MDKDVHYGQYIVGRCGSSMLRPSPNNGTLWLHNDDDDLVLLLLFQMMLLQLKWLLYI